MGRVGRAGHGVQPPVTDRTADQPELAGDPVDRAAHRRTDAGWLDRAWNDPGCRVLVIDQGRMLVDPAHRLVLLAPADAPPGERIFLGVPAGTEGSAYYAVAARLPRRPDARPVSLREVGADLGAREAMLATQAVALTNWHATHQHCPRCGAPTVPVSAGHVRRCPADGSDHFPRTDPAVIMRVCDAAGRCLLARSPRWPVGRRSVLAGFVEPGESIEQAVRREVAEEVGLEVTGVRYWGSQPWPFPASLMLACTAQATGRHLVVDPEELAEAGWYSRSDLRADVAAGTLSLPPRLSIARRLVDAWLAESGPTAEGG